MVGMVINPIVGVYIPIIRIPIKGGMTIPNITSLDPGTYSIPTFTFSGAKMLGNVKGFGLFPCVFLWVGQEP